MNDQHFSATLEYVLLIYRLVVTIVMKEGLQFFSVKHNIHDAQQRIQSKDTTFSNKSVD
jgi:hypothetical protein